MQKPEKQNTSTSNLIWKTAGKTTAVLCVLLVLFCAFFLLLAPGSTSDFFYKMGMKKSAATLAYTQAERTNSFDDWWAALVKCVDGEVWDKAYSATLKIEAHDDYVARVTNEVADDKLSVGNTGNKITYDKKYYLAYNKVKCGLLAYNDEKNREIFLNYAIKQVTETSGWGVYISNASQYNYYVYTPNALKGYIDALCINTSIPLDNVTSVLYELHTHTGKFANVDNAYYSETNWYASKKRDLACYVVKLCRARPDEPVINYTDRYYWHNAASIPMPS